MNKSPFIFSVLFAGFLRAESPSVERTFTLSQSVQNAMQNSQVLISAEQDVKIARQRIREAQSNFYPEIGLNFNASRYLAEQTYLIPPELGYTVLRPSRGLEPDNFYSGRVFLRQTIYSGGRILNNLRLAKAGLEQARIRREQIRGRVVYGAVTSFYDLIFARRVRAAAEETLRAVENSAAKFPPADSARRVALDSLSARLRRKSAEKVRAEGKAYLNFLQALGIELYSRVDVTGDLETQVVDLNQAKLLAWALESRPELRVTEYQRQIDQLAVNLQEGERNPVVALGAGYERTDPKFPLRTVEWNTTLNVSIPVFDGFSSRARIRQRKYQADQGRVQRAQIEDQINAEVRDGFADLEYWRKELDLRKIEFSRLKSAAARMAVKDALDGAQSREWILESQEAYWEAVHGHRAALAKLEKIVGRPLNEK